MAAAAAAAAAEEALWVAAPESWPAAGGARLRVLLASVSELRALSAQSASALRAAAAGLSRAEAAVGAEAIATAELEGGEATDEALLALWPLAARARREAGLSERPVFAVAVEGAVASAAASKLAAAWVGGVRHRVVVRRTDDAATRAAAALREPLALARRLEGNDTVAASASESDAARDALIAVDVALWLAAACEAAGVTQRAHTAGWLLSGVAGEHGRALAHADALLALEPRSPQALLMRGEALLRVGGGGGDAWRAAAATLAEAAAAATAGDSRAQLQRRIAAARARVDALLAEAEERDIDAEEGEDAAGEWPLPMARVASVLGGYPSTPHLPFSPQVSDDDSRLGEAEARALVGVPVVVTEKLDGGNCCLMGGRVLARTHKHEADHESFDTIRGLYAQLIEQLSPREQRTLALFGENMTGVHSIRYPALRSFFYLFSVYDTRARAFWAWDDVAALAARIGVPAAPVVFRGRFESLQAMRDLMVSLAARPSRLALSHEDGAAGPPVCPEGFVVRRADAIPGPQFAASVAKFVRRGHVQTDESWRRSWAKAVLFRGPPTRAEQEARYAGAGAGATAAAAAGGGGGNGPAAAAAAAAAAGGVAGAERGAPRVSLRNAPKLIMTVGLPGAGKSTFCERLLNTAPRGTFTRISRDDIGSSGATEEAFSRAVKRGDRVLFDGANVEPATRRRWLEMAFNPPDAVAVFFDTDAAECARRAALRRGHPSGDLFQWGGKRIVASQGKKLVPPQPAEGFKTVFVVRSLADANALLVKWGGAPLEADAFVRNGDEAGGAESGGGGGAGKEEKNEEEEEEEEGPGAEAKAEGVEEGRDAGPAYALAEQGAEMNLARLLERLALREADVLGVYVYGSRLWGGAHAGSDWDVVVALADAAAPLKARHAGAQIDALTIGADEFCRRLAEHRFLYVLCLHLPRAAVWRSAWDPAQRARFKFSPAALAAAVREEAERDLEMARKLSDKAQPERAARTVGHALRMTTLAAQLVVAGAVSDWAAAQPQLQRLRAEAPQTWAALSPWCERVRAMMRRL